MQTAALNLSNYGVLSLYLTERYPASQISIVSVAQIQSEFIQFQASKRNLTNQVCLSKLLTVSAYVLTMTTFFRRIPK